MESKDLTNLVHRNYRLLNLYTGCDQKLYFLNKKDLYKLKLHLYQLLCLNQIIS